MFETIDSQLAELVDPKTGAERRKALHDALSEAGAPTKQSVLGGLLGGLGAGAIGAAIGAPVGKYVLHKGAPTASARAAFAEGTSRGFEVNPVLKRLGEEMREDIEGGTKTAEKLADDIAKSYGAGVGSGVLGGLGGYLGGYWGAEKEPNKNAEEALALLVDPTVPAEKKKALAAMYKAHADAVAGAAGSDILSGLASYGVQVPMAAALNFGGGKALGKILVPDKRLDKSWIAGTKGGRAMMAETMGDVAIANPLGGAAGVLAYNASQDPYESPFDKKDVKDVNRT